MNLKSLYLIQSNYLDADAILAKFEQIYAVDDAILLMGDAVLWVENAQLTAKKNIFILANDAELLTGPIPAHIQIIDYAAFADLVLAYTRCISFK